MNGAGRRNKGHKGELEVVQLLTAYARPVCEWMGRDVPEFKRNVTQSQGGGYDVVGLEWLAIEVKRVETEFQKKWWTQVLDAKGEAQVACLLFRRNRGSWRAMVELATPVGSRLITVHATLDVDQFKYWFQWQLASRLDKASTSE